MYIYKYIDIHICDFSVDECRIKLPILYTHLISSIIIDFKQCFHGF